MGRKTTCENEKKTSEPKNETTRTVTMGKTPLEKKQLTFLRDVGSSLRWYLKQNIESEAREGWTGKHPWKGRIKSPRWDGYVEGLLTGLHIADTSAGCTKLDQELSSRKYKQEHEMAIALWRDLQTQLKTELNRAYDRVRKIQDALESLDSTP